MQTGFSVSSFTDITQTGIDKSVGNSYMLERLHIREFRQLKISAVAEKETVFIQAGEQIFKEERTLFADSSFFDIFSFPVVSGNRSEFLRSPDVAIITESLSKKYFGNEDPIGKTIYGVNPGKKPVTVQGVVKMYSLIHT